jgi:peptidoglycan/LPS O-acetylase OafA/YrhL
MIDGLRGIAALAVVMHHLDVAPLGRYAVMIFFVISGYCIAASAESCRRHGVAFGTFMWRRLRRIYPPYFFALSFYAATRLGKWASGGHNDLARPWLDWVQNLTLTQWVSLPLHPVADAPQNPKLMVAAFWSLNYEDQFYLVMGLALLLAVRRRVPIAVTVSILAAIGLVWNWAVPGGWITGIFIEYWSPFAVGAALFYVLCLYGSNMARGAFLALALAVGVFSATRIFPWAPDTELHERAYVELATACAFALFLFCMRPLSATVSRLWLWKPIAALGAISYSLYLVHQFNLTFVAVLAFRIAPNGGRGLHLVLEAGLQIAVAAAFWYCCERPFLNRTSRSAERSAAPKYVEVAS